VLEEQEEIFLLFIVRYYVTLKRKIKNPMTEL